ELIVSIASVLINHPLIPPISFFSLTATSTTEIYTLSLHDALPISVETSASTTPAACWCCPGGSTFTRISIGISVPPEMRVNVDRSEEHTSELQSRGHLVCRLLLEKKNNAA